MARHGNILIDFRNKGRQATIEHFRTERGMLSQTKS